MSWYDPNDTGTNPYQDATRSLPALMTKVYVWMTLALAITGLTAFCVAENEALVFSLLSNRLAFWVLIIAEFGIVAYLSSRIMQMSFATAGILFGVYSVLNGVVLSSLLLVYTLESLTSTFLITAGTFGAMAFYGYTTKKDLTSFGKILFMALIGLVIATVVNMFLKSPGFDYILSYIGVAIFIGLTAWDSQKIKQMLQTQYDMSEGAQKLALLGALTLYLDFINLFLYLLRIFGNNKD